MYARILLVVATGPGKKSGAERSAGLRPGLFFLPGRHPPLAVRAFFSGGRDGETTEVFLVAC